VFQTAKPVFFKKVPWKLTESRAMVGKNMRPFHATNGFLIFMPKSQEYLGVGHIHRPQKYTANPYAPFGHHYTHAFYTVSAHPPFRLLQLSPEFVIPSKRRVADAEVIQFVSGLEVIERNGHEYVVLSYGINDCEAAAFFVALKKVNSLLRRVEEGKEVLDLMKRL
jgi:hypothetical protein